MAKDIQGNTLEVGQRVAYPVSTSILGIDTIKSIGPKTVTLQEGIDPTYPNYGSIRRRHDEVVIL